MLEGTAARGLALVADAQGGTSTAYTILTDARRRTNRLADPYVWLDGYILDAQCTLGRRHGHPETATWVTDLNELASRSGMRELRVRSLLHGAALGAAVTPRRLDCSPRNSTTRSSTGSPSRWAAGRRSPPRFAALAIDAALLGLQALGAALTEAVVHSWDLAKATGQDTSIDDDLASTLLAQLEATIGRRCGQEAPCTLSASRSPSTQTAQQADRLSPSSADNPRSPWRR